MPGKGPKLEMRPERMNKVKNPSQASCGEERRDTGLRSTGEGGAIPQMDALLIELYHCIGHVLT